MKEWFSKNSAPLMAIVTVVASVFAILWVIWQVQYQIADRITESENRLRVEISETEDTTRRQNLKGRGENHPSRRQAG